jgi:hypothetical protein
MLQRSLTPTSFSRCGFFWLPTIVNHLRQLMGFWQCFKMKA